MSDVALREFCAQDADWVVDSHARHYREVDGFDDSFAPLVRGVIDGFVAGHDPAAERGWIAWDGAVRCGSIFCVRLDKNTAKLRLFLVSRDMRGTGLGQRMHDHCVGFAREAGYSGMTLWTHESHEAACALYDRNGWDLAASRPVQSFGQSLVEQTRTLQF